MQYDAVQRVFVLPKPHSPHTLVVAALDPPIRKGQTHYAHVLAHFHTDEEVSLSLEMTPEQIDAKNEKVQLRLKPTTYIQTQLWATSTRTRRCRCRWRWRRSRSMPGTKRCATV